MKEGCVKFKKNSWHYKLVNYVFRHYLIYYGIERQINLCPYMRHVIASIVLLPSIILWNSLPYRIRDHEDLVKTELIFLLLVIIVAWLLDFADTYEEINNNTPQVFPPFRDMVAIGFFGGNAVGVVGGLILWGAFSLSDYIKKRPKIKSRTTGLIKTYMKAKHDKICPCVEFEADKK